MKKKLLEQAQAQGTPLIDGEKVTFLWHGKNPPQLMGDFNDWEEKKAVPLTKIGAQVWAAEMTFPCDVYMEYLFLRDGESIEDPLNPRKVTNGIGHYNNFFYMPEAAPTPLAEHPRGAPHGEVARHLLETDEILYGKQRSVFLYQPPVSERCPLLVVWDGKDYLRRAHLAEIVDNLIAQGRMEPVAMAMVENGGPARGPEYACSEATIAFLVTSVLPFAQKNLNLINIKKNPGSFAVLGSSLGGLMALYTALRLPDIFGSVISQSGAFSFWGHDTIVYDLVRQMKPLPFKVWMDAGSFEQLKETNRRMSRLLEDKGYRVAYREYPGGHNYTAWQNDVWRALETLF